MQPEQSTLRRSENHNNILAALLRAQAELEPVAKNKTNDHFRNTYADWACVFDAGRRLLVKNGVLTLMTVQPEANTLTCHLLHAESGQWVEADYPLRPSRADMQGYASSLTYAKRYLFATLLGVVSEDDPADDDCESAVDPARRNRDEARRFDTRKVERIKGMINAAASEAALVMEVVPVIRDAALSMAENATISAVYKDKLAALRGDGKGEGAAKRAAPKRGMEALAKEMHQAQEAQ